MYMRSAFYYCMLLEPISNLKDVIFPEYLLPLVPSKTFTPEFSLPIACCAVKSSYLNLENVGLHDYIAQLKFRDVVSVLDEILKHFSLQISNFIFMTVFMLL